MTKNYKKSLENWCCVFFPLRECMLLTAKCVGGCAHCVWVCALYVYVCVNERDKRGRLSAALQSDQFHEQSRTWTE